MFQTLHSVKKFGAIIIVAQPSLPPLSIAMTLLARKDVGRAPSTKNVDKKGLDCLNWWLIKKRKTMPLEKLTMVYVQGENLLELIYDLSDFLQNTTIPKNFDSTPFTRRKVALLYSCNLQAIATRLMLKSCLGTKKGNPLLNRDSLQLLPSHRLGKAARSNTSSTTNLSWTASSACAIPIGPSSRILSSTPARSLPARTILSVFYMHGSASYQ